MIVVAAALRRSGDHAVLMQQRPAGTQHAGLWEFPGGKVEPGEGLRAALARELNEELGICVHVADLVPLTFSAIPLLSHGDQAGDLTLLLFGCDQWAGDILPLQAADITWVLPAALSALPMPPADVPLAAYIAARARP